MWRDEDIEQAGFAEVASLMATDVMSMQLPRGMGGQSGSERRQSRATDESVHRLKELLKQLRTEPAEDDEIVAKFALYETYGQEVERMRSELFTFYEDIKQDLPPAVARGVEQQLRAIDSHEAMGIPDEAREWFVYQMMKRAERNSWAMDSALAALKAKLELLAKSTQTDCPICLEAFDEERPAEMLACCHSVCKECWSHWTSVKKGHPFCPLCKHMEFITTLASQAQPANLATVASVPDFANGSQSFSSLDSGSGDHAHPSTSRLRAFSHFLLIRCCSAMRFRCRARRHGQLRPSNTRSWLLNCLPRPCQ